MKLVQKIYPQGKFRLQLKLHCPLIVHIFQFEDSRKILSCTLYIFQDHCRLNNYLICLGTMNKVQYMRLQHLQNQIFLYSNHKNYLTNKFLHKYQTHPNFLFHLSYKHNQGVNSFFFHYIPDSLWQNQRSLSIFYHRIRIPLYQNLDIVQPGMMQGYNFHQNLLQSLVYKENIQNFQLRKHRNFERNTSSKG